ncbi:esterase [Mesocricetibacter intestinalis]|uniref:Esterase n=1 Tax=Mesocricetibacter intestinalis TaxID=1521930 RepID=A0A4R6V7H8_9PAST|nr:alpha/beta fold hydrolase [Mesocricetibacter intestinalis]TDQ56961.1 esterase [Mesocricetibacter intestinalis]
MHAPNLLSYQFHQLKQKTTAPVLVFLHGLFGDMNNLGVIARHFARDYSILRVDLRNHGHSFHSEDMDYHLMNGDLLNLFEHLNLERLILIGHSMGGKTAMSFAAAYPQLLEKLVVIDIAPVIYDNHGHDGVFEGLFAVRQARPEDRRQADELLAQYIDEQSIRLFMLKSFDPQMPECFRFNLSALHRNYPRLMGWHECRFNKPTLFIKGGLSDYIQPAHTDAVLTQFPQASAFTVNGAGHWIHAQKPEIVARVTRRFLEQP